jgi:uncharacterized OB-fold protein
MSDRLTHGEWNAAVKAGDLLGLHCGECDRTHGTPKAACPYCGSRTLETVELPTEGEVYTETTINVPPEGIDGRGYQVALVEVGDARITARLVDQDVAIGDEVVLAGFDEDDQGNATPRFEAR